MSADVPDELAQHALGLRVKVRIRTITGGVWEVYEWDSAAGLEHVRALYETRRSAEEHAERIRPCPTCGLRACADKAASR